VAARELGQGRRRQRAVPARLRVGRQGADAEVRGRLYEGRARPRPPHEARRTGLAQSNGMTRRALAAGLLLPAAVLAHHVELLPPLEYEPPAAGSYALHRIMPAPEGRVVGLSGKTEPLSRYTHGAITLLGFIYTTCADPDGCPLAYRVFDALKEEISGNPR